MRRPSWDSNDASSPATARPARRRARARASASPAAPSSAGSTCSCVGLVAVQNAATKRPLSASKWSPCSTPPASSPSPTSTRSTAKSRAGLVERSCVHPRAAVDVVGQRVAIAFEMPEPLELADALVAKSLDRDRLDLARASRGRGTRASPCRRRASSSAGDRRRPTCRARGGSRRAGTSTPGPAPRSASRTASRARRPRPRRGRRRPSCSRRPARRGNGLESTQPRSRRMCSATSTRPCAAPARRDGRHDRLFAGLDREECDLRLVVDLDEVRTASCEHGVLERLWEPAVDGIRCGT